MTMTKLEAKGLSQENKKNRYNLCQGFCKDI